jgi:hypothetical protein
MTRCIYLSIYLSIDSDYKNSIERVMSSFQGSSRTATEMEYGMKLIFDVLLTKTAESQGTKDLPINTRPVLAQNPHGQTMIGCQSRQPM